MFYVRSDVYSPPIGSTLTGSVGSLTPINKNILGSRGSRGSSKRTGNEFTRYEHFF